MALRLLLCLLALVPQESKSVPGADMDYGPFFSSTLSRGKSDKDADILAFKAITVKVDKDAALGFATDLLRMAAAWTGGFLDLSETHLTTASGRWPARPGAALKVATRPGPGWAKGDDLKDPRSERRGPLPKDWAQYHGLYVNGDKVVLSYSVGACSVLEMPGFLEAGSATAFTRTFNLGPSTAPLRMVVYDDDTPGHVDVGLAAAPGTATLEKAGASAIHLKIPSHAAPVRFMVILWIAGKGDLSAVKQLPDLSTHCKGGASRWITAVVTRGTTGKEDGPYVVDTLTLPDANPWKSWLRISAHDFFSDGRAAISTWSGDVWVVSGIDAELRELQWKRFATGLYEPLGLRIVDDKVYVLGRDQITRLHDLNGDGEADFYESFNSDCKVTTNGHAYATNLETDPEGNFYYTKCADNTPHGGTVMKVSKDGKYAEPFAVGLRNPNGLGISPTGFISEADNQGEWVPASRIDFVEG